MSYLKRRVLGHDHAEYIRPEWFIISDWPENLIPNGGEPFCFAEDNYTVRGFYDKVTGEMHIQEITKEELSKLPKE